MTKKILLAHPGTQHSIQLYRELMLQDFPVEFWTCLAFSTNNLFYRIIPRNLRNRFLSRLMPRDLPVNLKILPFCEIRSLIRNEPFTEDYFFYRNKLFQQKIERKALRSSEVVIGFDTSSWILIERAKETNNTFFLDVSIAHPEEKEMIYRDLAKRYPKWKEQISPKKKDYIALEKMEHDLADYLIVPSTFVKNTYVKHGIAEEKLIVNPFGVDTSEFPYLSRKPRDTPVFLFFGSLTARKGLPMLLEAWDKVEKSRAKLLIAGYGNLPSSVQLPNGCENLGKISSQDRVSLFERSDVFVFPSFFEGLARVQIEAASTGLPIIGSKNSGADDIVNDGIEGFIIETGNVDQLSEKIQYFINNPEKIQEMGRLARLKAEQFTWKAYGKRWAKIILDLC